jgi:hypothetical protein
LYFFDGLLAGEKIACFIRIKKLFFDKKQIHCSARTNRQQEGLASATLARKGGLRNLVRY